MADGIEIRAFTRDDVEPFMDLFEAVAEERLWMGTEPGFDRPARTRRFLEHLDDTGSRYAGFVALDGGAIVGQCGVYPDEEHEYMLGIAIAQPYRGRGIGRALMEHIEAWARERNIASLSLMVFAHNVRALALYDAMGYERVAYYERDVIRQTGEVYDTILMTKPLSDT